MRMHILLALLLVWPASAWPRSNSLKPPLAPTSLTATAATQTATRLSWTPPAPTAGTRAAVTGYKVEVSNDGSTGWTLLVTIPGAASAAYEHTGLTAGVPRHYRVIATSDAGDSEPSNTARTATRLAPTELIMRALGARVAGGTVSSNYAKSEASAADKNFLSRFADGSFYLALESQSHWKTWNPERVDPSLGGILNVRLTTVPVRSETELGGNADLTTEPLESETAMDDAETNFVPRPSTEVQVGILANLWHPSFQVASHSFHWAVGITTRSDFRTIPDPRNHGSTGSVVWSWPVGFRLSLYETASAIPMAYVDYSLFSLYESRDGWWEFRHDLEARAWIGNAYLGFDITQGGNLHDDVQIVVGATLALGSILPTGSTEREQ